MYKRVQFQFGGFGGYEDGIFGKQRISLRQYTHSILERYEILSEISLLLVHHFIYSLCSLTRLVVLHIVRSHHRRSLQIRIKTVVLRCVGVGVGLKLNAKEQICSQNW